MSSNNAASSLSLPRSALLTATPALHGIRLHDGPVGKGHQRLGCWALVDRGRFV